MSSIRVAEGHVDPRDLLILKNIADHLMYGKICPDGKLAYAIAVFVAMSVLPDLPFELRIVGLGRLQPVAPHLECERRILQIAELGAQVIADNSIDNERAVYI